MCSDNSNPRSIIDWSFTPKIQAQYDCVVEQNRRLQAEFGIESKTIDQRYQDYLKKQEETKKHTQMLGQRRPIPKWKL